MTATVGMTTERDRDESSSIWEVVASPGVSEKIEGIARASGYRAYSKDGVPNCRKVAMAALEGFLSTGSIEAAEEVVRASHDVPLGLACEMEMIRSSGAFRSVIEMVRQEILTRCPHMDPQKALSHAGLAVANAVEKRLTSLDDSVPFDVIDGEDVVVCYMPGLPEGLSPEEALESGVGLTSCRGFGSDCVTIDPDEAFARFLTVVNVSSDEYMSLVLEMRGVDLAEANPAWGSFSVLEDPSRDKLLDGDRLLEAIDGCMYGFHPIVAFKAPARFLIERDWSVPLSITGGIVGLHNFKNGSGDPQRFEGTFTVGARPGAFFVGENRRCDFEEVYGFVLSTFDSIVEDGHGGMAPRP